MTCILHMKCSSFGCMQVELGTKLLTSQAAVNLQEVCPVLLQSPRQSVHQAWWLLLWKLHPLLLWQVLKQTLVSHFSCLSAPHIPTLTMPLCCIIFIVSTFPCKINRQLCVSSPPPPKKKKMKKKKKQILAQQTLHYIMQTYTHSNKRRMLWKNTYITISINQILSGFKKYW